MYCICMAVFAYRQAGNNTCEMLAGACGSRSCVGHQHDMRTYLRFQRLTHPNQLIKFERMTLIWQTQLWATDWLGLVVLTRLGDYEFLRSALWDAILLILPMSVNIMCMAHARVGVGHCNDTFIFS